MFIQGGITHHKEPPKFVSCISTFLDSKRESIRKLVNHPVLPGTKPDYRQNNLRLFSSVSWDFRRKLFNKQRGRSAKCGGGRLAVGAGDLPGAAKEPAQIFAFSFNLTYPTKTENSALVFLKIKPALRGPV